MYKGINLNAVQKFWPVKFISIVPESTRVRTYARIKKNPVCLLSFKRKNGICQHGSYDINHIQSRGGPGSYISLLWEGARSKDVLR